ncbi:CGNR zinc finger domain-containing protein [Streptomyces sp. NRRL S-87]|uniref:CGNR zinc finger domain-containing protein n=1 Tax=Streptomyces sp. NRRL S-87 TaxID=1463920 RepID=UPI0004BE5644|nr:CGNR zinc finger domain-containing protein [Streptomyces sp. NRRL S-87]
MTERAPAPGGLALVEALINTLRVDTGEDRLAAEFGLSGAALTEAADLREALRAACLAHAGHAMSDAAHAGLNDVLAAAPLTLSVTPDGTAALRPTGDGLPARVAAAIAEAVAAGTWQRLKACAADDCRWAYYDRSPAGRGRWCTMSVCGSRAKMRTYRSRQS